MSLYTETDLFSAISLTHKTNLYFKEVTIVNKEACPLLIELIAKTYT